MSRKLEKYSLGVYVVGRLTPSGVMMLGTGFLVTNDGAVVTTKHVLGETHDNLVILAPECATLNTYQDLTKSQCNWTKAEVAEIDPIKDLAILHSSIRWSGRISELVGFDSVDVSDRLGILGFPHCVEGRRILTYQSAELGAKVLIESGGLKIKHGVLNIQSRPGQSGSLVFGIDSETIAGVLVGAWIPAMARDGISLGGINPRELHQTTHCVSAEYIKEML